MPETWFRIRWPDGVEEECYSPSTVILEHLRAGDTYRIDDFAVRCQSALDLAARRVAAKYGYRCSAADAQAAKLARAITRFTPQEEVTCLTIR